MDTTGEQQQLAKLTPDYKMAFLQFFCSMSRAGLAPDPPPTGPPRFAPRFAPLRLSEARADAGEEVHGGVGHRRQLQQELEPSPKTPRVWSICRVQHAEAATGYNQKQST